MQAARFQKISFGVTLAILLGASMLSDPAAAYTSDEEQACTGDAFRLCSSEIPNVDRITACMYAKRTQLSPGCRAFFKSEPQPELTPVDATTPAGVTPRHKRASTHVTKKKKRKPSGSGDDS